MYKLLSFFIILTLFSYNLKAQRPGCDNNAAGQITVGSSCSYTSWDSNNNNDWWDNASGCGGWDGDDVWGWFTATSTSTTITYSADAGFDPVLHLFEGGCATAATLTAVACADNTGSGGIETITYATTIGTVYRVRVQDYWDDASYGGDICVYNAGGGGGPANDDCSNATTLNCGDALIGETTVGTSNTAHGTACGMGNYGVWYTFVGDGNQTTITVNNSYDIELSISSGSCGSFTNIVCSDFPENHTFTTTNGVTYYVYIADWLTSGTDVGTFDISRTCVTVTPPVNDDCTNAESLTVNPDRNCGTITSGTVEFATASAQTNDCFGTADDDVWYSFVATATTHYVDLLNIAGSTTDMYHSVYEGTCGAIGSAIRCNDLNSSTLNGLTIGNTYYVRVYTYTSTGGQNSTFDVCVGSDPPPITACSGNFYDTGGSSGQYANNEDYDITYCTSIPGECISVTFSSFSTESSYDYLTIYDGPNTSSTLIGSYSGTTLNGQTITSTSGGCLTFNFDSDGSGINSGWSASISCATCPPPPPPSAQDCNGGTSICSDASFSGNSNGSGSIVDINSSTDGCLSGENETSWYFFEAQTGGTLEFGIKPQNGTDDYDFAMWGPFPSGSTPATICPPSSAPIRCSFAAGAPNPATGTGLNSGASDTSEGVSGDDIVSPLTLNTGDVYILLIDNYSTSTSPFDMDITTSSGLSLDCVQLPIELIDFNGFAKEGYNILNWQTITEINNDVFEIEKSNNGVLFSLVGKVKGAGNSSNHLEYNFIDNNPNARISYYRLKQIDFDGEYTYSNVVAVKQNKGSEVSIFPNPTAGKVKLNFVSRYDGNYKINVFDISKAIYEQELFVEKGNKIINFDLFENLNKGFYIVKITDENDNIIKTERIVKH